MVSKSMYALGAQPSGIRELFEFGRQRAKEVGAENVFDFSLGNPAFRSRYEAEAISKL